jgi:hypothetical protein
MHRLEETSYGYRIEMGESMDGAALAALLKDIESTIPRRGDFALLIDMSRTPAFPTDAQEGMKRCIAALMERGMGRQAVILGSTIAILQAKRLSKDTGIIDLCRYYDATTDPDWESRALDWLVRGVDR